MTFPQLPRSKIVVLLVPMRCQQREKACSVRMRRAELAQFRNQVANGVTALLQSHDFDAELFLTALC